MSNRGKSETAYAFASHYAVPLLANLQSARLHKALPTDRHFTLQIQLITQSSFGSTATRPSEDGAPSLSRCPVTPTNNCPLPPIIAGRPPVPPIGLLS
jgi:hypothetical protein